MNSLQLINQIQTPVVVLDKDMNIVDANDAYQQRCELDNIIDKKCFECAYKFNEGCDAITGFCPAKESFRTKDSSSAIHNFWVEYRAIVEEVTTTPIIENNGRVNHVIEEFRDISSLLGLNNGILTICSYCRRIRNKDGQWVVFEAYMRKQTGSLFSHGICEECEKKAIDCL